MSWNVLWLPGSEQELADAWLAPTDRAAVTHAAVAIDQALILDPENFGESVRKAAGSPLRPRWACYFASVAANPWSKSCTSGNFNGVEPSLCG